MEFFPISRYTPSSFFSLLCQCFAVFCLNGLSTAVNAEDVNQAVLDCERADTAYLSKDLDSAQVYLKRCRQALPDYLPGLTLMAKIHYAYERYEVAAESFSEAIKQGADSEGFAYEWAQSLLASGDFTTLKDFTGYRHYAQSVRIDWLKARAQACMALDQQGCARESYFRLQELSDDIAVNLGFADIAMRNHNWQSAQ